MTVLGGTGFVGRHVAAAFAAADVDVLTIARHSSSANHRFTPLDLSMTPRTVLAEILDTEDPEIVVDAVGSSWGLTDAEMESRCTIPSRRLLDALTLVRCRPRLVHLGSVLEHGSAMHRREDGRALPTSAYGRAKLAATTAVLAATSDGAADGVVLRLANAVGPGLPAESLLGRVASALLAATRTGAPAVVRLSPLVAHRDYVDVRDVADAVVAASHANATGQVIDVGRGQAVSVRTLVHLLIEVSGIAATVIEQDQQAPDWRAETTWSQVDTSRAGEVLGWRPQRELLGAVRAYWHSTSAGSSAR